MHTTLHTDSVPRPDLSADLLRGADEIAAFLFGSPGERRRIYYLVETSRLPVFRLGAALCARRSVLLEWIAAQEHRGWERGPCVPRPAPAARQ